MSITLSDSAAERVRAFLTRKNKSFGLRLGIHTAGCSGMTYALELIDQPKSDDVVFEDKGIKVVVSSHNLRFLDGTRLDFIKEGTKEEFKFTNPNVKEECGCGESFQV